MKSQLQISFADIPHSDAVETRIRDEAARLDQLHSRITAMRVVVARPHHRHHKGDAYHIRIRFSVPGAPEIAISREPAVTDDHDDIYVTIRDAFSAARRRLHDIAERQQGRVKAHMREAAQE